MSKRKSLKAGANLVSSARPDSLELTVYQYGDAVVHESRTVSLARGKNSILLEGLPTAFVEDSFDVEEVSGPGAFKLGPDCFQPADLNVQALLTRSVGNTITLVEQTQQGVLRHTGKLLFVLGNQVVLQDAEGVKVLPLTPKFDLTSLPKGLSATPSLTLEPTVSEAGSYIINSMYETGGLSWSARYSIYYNEKTNRMTLKCRVKLTNGTGADYEDAVFKLLAGANTSRGGRAKARGAARAAGFESMQPMAAAAAFDMPQAESAQVESVGEQKLYTLPDGLTIKAGQTKRPYLVVAADIPVDPEYYLPNTGYWQHDAAEENPKLPVYQRLKSRNDSEHNLGMPLPAGEASVYQPDSSGKQQKTDPSLYLQAVAAGEAFKFDLTTPSSDIKATRRLVRFHEDPQPEEPETEELPEGDDDGAFEGGAPMLPLSVGMEGGPGVGSPEEHSRRRREVAESARRGKKKAKKPAPRFREEVREVTIFNFKEDRAVEVLVHDQLPGRKFEWLEKSHDFSEQTQAQGTFKVQVPAGEKVTITYGIRWQVN